LKSAAPHPTGHDHSIQVQSVHRPGGAFDPGESSINRNATARTVATQVALPRKVEASARIKRNRVDFEFMSE